MKFRVLFISNGHGEDNDAVHIIAALRELAPDTICEALPIVGKGTAYHRLDVPVIAPTLELPSQGFAYRNRWLYLSDIRGGLAGLTVAQVRAVRSQAKRFDLVHATGDTVSQAFAWISGRRYVSFISSLSALYEGHLTLDPLLRPILRSPRCRAILTRDPVTAEDLARQGFKRVHFGGFPALDALRQEGRDLDLVGHRPVIALLPGSRMPEAGRNFLLMLRLVRKVARAAGQPIAFRAAIVPSLWDQLEALLETEGLKMRSGRIASSQAEYPDVLCAVNAFADILHASSLVVAMAGQAAEQAVALGKPVVQFPGEGPQFTYAFVEAQQRLLGMSCQTFGNGPADESVLEGAASAIVKTLADHAYLQACATNGPSRLGMAGGSRRIARVIVDTLDDSSRGACR